MIQICLASLLFVRPINTVFDFILLRQRIPILIEQGVRGGQLSFPAFVLLSFLGVRIRVRVLILVLGRRRRGSRVRPVHPFRLDGFVRHVQSLFLL